MHPWVEGILMYSNEGFLPFSMGNNHEIAKFVQMNIILKEQFNSYKVSYWFFFP